MISTEEALKIVCERTVGLGHEVVEIASAADRVLAEDIVSDTDLPPFDRARMDGYAVRSADVATAPVSLKVVGEIAAGRQFNGFVGVGEAVQIFTGAPVPRGADAVQKVEVTERDGDSVVIAEPVSSGQFITPRGVEVSRGTTVARKGASIGAAEMAVLASFGYSKVRVGRQPRVSIVSTGSELVDVSATPSGPQIRNSNSYTIASYARRAGALVTVLGTVRDTVEETRAALEKAFQRSDVVITSGGVSMGEYDLVKTALLELGAEVYFDKVAIRPGKPTVFGRRENAFFFGLPGNPVSTSVTFNVFARPAIRLMQGSSEPLLPLVTVVAANGLTDTSRRRSFLPGILTIEDGEAIARSLKWAGSSDLVGFMNANCLIVVPEEVHEIKGGSKVRVMLLESVVGEGSHGADTS